jgi:uncharacterized protein
MMERRPLLLLQPPHRLEGIRLSIYWLDDILSRELGRKCSTEFSGCGLGISFIAGNLSGLLGIGGGVFKVPALHLACGVPIKAAAATSNSMIGVTATASAFLYFGRGEIRPALTAGVVLGVIVGSAIGSWLSPKIQGLVVKKLFALLLLGVAVQMFLRVFG